MKTELQRQRIGPRGRAVIGFALGFSGVLARLVVGLSLSSLAASLIAASFLRSDSELHPLLGEIPKAGQTEWNHLEGDGVGHWTSNGVRRLSLPDKAEGHPILLVGDSFTEAVQVSDDEHYGQLLEKELRLAGKSLPVLIFGKSGWTLADYLAAATNLQMVFKPQWVVVQLEDASLFHRAWEKASPGFARFVRDDEESGIRVLFQPLPKKAQRSLLNQLAERFPHLVPYYFTYVRVKEFKKWFETERPWFHASSSENGPPGEERSSWTNYPVGEEIKLLADAYQHRLTILYLPPFDPKEPSTPTAGEEILRNLAAKNGIRFVSLRDKYQELALKGRAPFGFNNTQFNYGHWNRSGHEAAAQILFNDFMNLGL